MTLSLHQIVTKDKVPLEGLYFEPEKKGELATLWISGLTGYCTDNPKRTNAIAEALCKQGIGFANFNTRGSGVSERVSIGLGKRKKYVQIGTANERFTDCVKDIDAMIGFLMERGYKKVVLMGHSTGANKSCYYVYKTRDKRVGGLVLLGPLSDIPGIKKSFGVRYKKALAWAQASVKQGNDMAIMPARLTAGLTTDNFPWTAQRFVSIAREGEYEDTFPYYDSRRAFYWTKKLTVPVHVVIGSKDEHAEPSVPEIMSAFQNQIPKERYSSSIIPGADHGFKNHESELATEVTKWIAQIS